MNSNSTDSGEEARCGTTALGGVGLCLDCDYPLHGLESRRCPECGREFDPGNPATMNMGPPLGALHRFLLQPIGWPTHLLAVLAVLIHLWPERLPSDYPDVNRSADAFALLVMAWWGGRAVARWIVMSWRRNSLPRSMISGRWRAWYVWPVLNIVALELVWMDVPFRAGFWISKSAMDRFVQEVVSKPPGAAPPVNRRVGVYRIEWVETIPGGVRFLVAGAVDAGFAYSTVHPPSDPARYEVLELFGEDLFQHWYGNLDVESYQHIVDEWYVWSGRWIGTRPAPAPNSND